MNNHEKQFIVELGEMEFTPERAEAVIKTLDEMFPYALGASKMLEMKLNHAAFKYELGQYAMRIAKAKSIDTFRAKFAQHFFSP